MQINVVNVVVQTDLMK